MPQMLSVLLSDSEIAALAAEYTSVSDDASTVIHRLIDPLVRRQIGTQISAFVTTFQGLDPDSQTEILGQLAPLTSAAVATKTVVQ